MTFSFPPIRLLSIFLRNFPLVLKRSVMACSIQEVSRENSRNRKISEMLKSSIGELNIVIGLRLRIQYPADIKI